MAIQTLYDDGLSIPSTYDGGAYAIGISDCVCQGLGDEFTINYSANSLYVMFNTGSQAVIGGAFFHVVTATTHQMPANSTTYLCANIDMSKPNGERGSFVNRTSANMTSDIISKGSGSRDLLLYVVTTDANGVTSISDFRKIKSGPSLELDSALSSTSENAVMNKVINSALNGKANSSHTHGYIKSDGTVDQSTVGSGDQIVITDANYGSKIVRSNIAFNTSNSYSLRSNGTWGRTIGNLILNSSSGSWTSGNVISADVGSAYNIIYMEFYSEDKAMGKTLIFKGQSTVVTPAWGNYYGSRTVTYNANGVVWVGPHSEGSEYNNALVPRKAWGIC